MQLSTSSFFSSIFRREIREWKKKKKKKKKKTGNHFEERERQRERERERERERTKQFSCRRTSGAQPNGSLKNEDESPGRPLTPLRAFESVSGRTSISVLAPLLERRKNPFSKSRDRIRERERERGRERRPSAAKFQSQQAVAFVGAQEPLEALEGTSESETFGFGKNVLNSLSLDVV